MQLGMLIEKLAADVPGRRERQSMQLYTVKKKEQHKLNKHTNKTTVFENYHHYLIKIDL